MPFNQRAELIRQRALDGMDQIVAYLQSFNIYPIRRGDELRTLEGNLVDNEIDRDGLQALRAERGLENNAQSAPIFVLHLYRVGGRKREPHVIAKVRRGKPLQLFEGTSRERSLQSRSISFVARASTVLASML